MHGADDGATLPETTEGDARYFTGKYKRIVLPDTGHFIPRENPEAVIEAILAKD